MKAGVPKQSYLSPVLRYTGGMAPVRLSSRQLRQELSARNLQRAQTHVHELTFGSVPGVVYDYTEQGSHGNFLQPSLRRILADPRWAARLRKAYTGVHLLPRAADRQRGELECAASSDALLMNVFCYPGALRRRALCACLGIEPGGRAAFGVRVALPMRNGETDRTELDMRLGDVLVEAKLTETGFGRASFERLTRYKSVEESFDLDQLPRGSKFEGYQLIRGILAAQRHGMRYLVLLDNRRADLSEICFRVLCAVRSAEARSRFRLISWQELAGTLPPVLRQFLDEKYGITPV